MELNIIFIYLWYYIACMDILKLKLFDFIEAVFVKHLIGAGVTRSFERSGVQIPVEATFFIKEIATICTDKRINCGC
jgi:hypothetical protein